MESTTVKVPAENLPSLERFVYRLAENSPDTMSYTMWLDSLPNDVTIDELISRSFRFSPSQIEAATRLDKPEMKCSKWVNLRFDAEFDPATGRYKGKVFATASKYRDETPDLKLIDFGIAAEVWENYRKHVIDYVISDIIKSAEHSCKKAGE